MELVRNTSRWGVDLPAAALPVCAVPGSLGCHGQASSGSAALSPACTGGRRNISTVSRHARAALIRASTIRGTAYPKAVSTREPSRRGSKKASPPFAISARARKSSLERRWGGWLALLAARALHESGEVERLKGLVLLAPAVDFTEALILQKMSLEERTELAEKGVWLRAYSSEPYPVTRRLIEEGRNHLLFGDVIRTHCPVNILQGMQDVDVPWRHTMILLEHLAADPVSLTLVRDGDHRLSRVEDLARLRAAFEAMG